VRESGGAVSREDETKVGLGTVRHPAAPFRSNVKSVCERCGGNEFEGGHSIHAKWCGEIKQLQAEIAQLKNDEEDLVAALADALRAIESIRRTNQAHRIDVEAEIQGLREEVDSLSRRGAVYR
jgi:hypothetical protein